MSACLLLAVQDSISAGEVCQTNRSSSTQRFGRGEMKRELHTATKRLVKQKRNLKSSTVLTLNLQTQTHASELNPELDISSPGNGKISYFQFAILVFY